MNITEWRAHVDGTLEALTLICTTLIATHPEKESAMAILNQLSEISLANVDGDNRETQCYKDGIQKVVSKLDEVVDGVVLDELCDPSSSKVDVH